MDTVHAQTKKLILVSLHRFLETTFCTICQLDFLASHKNATIYCSHTCVRIITAVIIYLKIFKYIMLKSTLNTNIYNYFYEYYYCLLKIL